MADEPPLETACPTCGRIIVWGPDAPWRPFCSERCRLIDLGQWLAEEHRISEDEEESGTPFGPGERLYPDA